MKSDAIQELKSRFDMLSQRIPDENVEFWFARELMEPLGYARWENFLTVIKRAIESCETTGYVPDNHFRGVTKMVKLGSGAERAIDDFMLTRYACYKRISENWNAESRLTKRCLENNPGNCLNQRKKTDMEK